MRPRINQAVDNVMPSSGNSERVLLHSKYLMESVEPSSLSDCIRSGASLRVIARTLPDGRVSISGSVSQRMLRMRASGKIYRTWQTIKAFSLQRTKADLVVLRVLDSTKNRNHTEHIFADGEAVVTDVLRDLTRKLFLPMSRFEQTRYSWITRDGVRFVQGPALTARLDRDAEIEFEPVITALRSEIFQLIGELPVTAERFPLLKQVNSRGLCYSGHVFFRDAEDFKAVAENAFGKTRYRKPLAREIERLTGRASHDMSVLNWFRLFRGLVPIDWVIDAMRRTELNHGILFKSAELTQVRALLVRVPQPILGRILAEPIEQSMRILADTVRDIGTAHVQLRDLNLLPEMIAARGQRRIRGTQDLENLVRSMPVSYIPSSAVARSNRALSVMEREKQALYSMNTYNEQILLPASANPVATWELWKDTAFREAAEAILANHRRELMTAQQREREQRAEQRRLERLASQKERAAWAVETTNRLDGLQVDEYRLSVAREANTLAAWGSQLNNCIANYSHELQLDVFVAVIDSNNKVQLNVQISQDTGIQQFLGANNRDSSKALGHDTAQLVLEAFMRAGIPVDKHALGIRGLTIFPGSTTAALTECAA